MQDNSVSHKIIHSFRATGHEFQTLHYYTVQSSRQSTALECHEDAITYIVDLSAKTDGCPGVFNQ